ncbi:hypothetical protein BDW71DRAFT_177288 [Aspergillus fruticulosus]
MGQATLSRLPTPSFLYLSADELANRRDRLKDTGRAGSRSGAWFSERQLKVFEHGVDLQRAAILLPLIAIAVAVL